MNRVRIKGNPTDPALTDIFRDRLSATIPTQDLATPAVTVNNYITVYQTFNGSYSSKRGRIMDAMITIMPGEDGYFVAECPALPGCISQGKTREEALKNIKEAIELCWEVRKEKGLPLPEFVEVEV